MTDGETADPVAKLLVIGEPKYSREFEWPDYRSFGINAEHVHSLISIATNHELINLTDESNPHAWAPIHAWRALGQLAAQEAIYPLLRLFHEVPDNDWVIEEMPDVFAMLGPAAFEALANYLSNPEYPPYSRLVAATSLMQMALIHPQVRSQSVDILADQLAEYDRNTPGVNGVLIANLVELEAVEKADLIQKVFAKGQVDRFIVGDWRDVKQRLVPSGNVNKDLSTTALPESFADISPDHEVDSAN